MSTTTAQEDAISLAAKREKVLAEAKHALARIFTRPGLTDAKRLEAAKTLNAGVQRLEFQLEKAELTSFPTAIELPVAGKCNLRCTMCGLSHGAPTYPNWTIEEVERFEPLFRFAQTVNPTGVGEPLAVKDLPKMLALFKRYALVAGFYSNGTLLTPERTEMILESNLNQLNISLDGATRENYERIRRHGSFDEVIANLRHFTKRRAERGMLRPALQIAMVLMRQNLHELPLLIRLAKDIGAESVYTIYEAGVLHEEMCQLEPERTNATLAEARVLANELGLHLMAPADLPVEVKTPVDAYVSEAKAEPKRVRCAYPWMSFLVHNDGQVGPCCRIKGEIDGFQFGHMSEKTPEELWNSPGMIHLRQRLASGDAPSVCQNCNIWTLSLQQA